MRLYVSVLVPLRADLLLVGEGHGSLKTLKAGVSWLCTSMSPYSNSFESLTCSWWERARLLEDIEGRSLVDLRLYVPVLEFFRELDLLLACEGARVLADLDGQSLDVVRLIVSVLDLLRELTCSW